jgi:DNA-binding LacI/PurR family transcriptional regulator
VIGYDDTSMARNAMVPLTSISYPAQVIADSVVELILSRIEKRYSGPARLVEVKATIVERESVKALSDRAVPLRPSQGPPSNANGLVTEIGS